MIEVNNVVMLELCAMQQVSDQSCIFRYLYANGVFDCPHRGQSMCVRSEPARTLNKMVSISWVPSLENQFDAPEHLTGAPGVRNLTTLNLNLDTKVALYSCNRIYRYSLAHMFPPSLLKRISCIIHVQLHFLVKRAHGVPEIRFTASDAGVTGFDGPARAIVEFDDGTVVVGLGSSAAQFVKAITQGRLF